MTKRRDFLKAAAGAVFLRRTPARARRPTAATLERAREMVRNGVLGRVGFCRVGQPELLDVVPLVLGSSRFLAEVDPNTEGAAFLGSEATLIVRGNGWRLFSRSS